MKKIFLLLLIIGIIAVLVGCENEVKPKEETSTETTNTVIEQTTTSQETAQESVPKNEQTGTAGSNMPLKDNLEEAEYQIKVAFQNWLEQAYGEKVYDARIYVEKMYTAEEEQEIEGLKEKNLGPNEVAFEARYELRPATEADVMELTATSGVYSGETGWITEKYNLGILRPATSGDAKYVITDLGTGW